MVAARSAGPATAATAATATAATTTATLGGQIWLGHPLVKSPFGASIFFTEDGAFFSFRVVGNPAWVSILWLSKPTFTVQVVNFVPEKNMLHR